MGRAGKGNEAGGTVSLMNECYVAGPLDLLDLYDNVNYIDRNEGFQLSEYIPKVYRTEV